MHDFTQHIINGIMFGSLYALIALGYTMVYGVLRLINFAHGDVFMVGAYSGFFAAHWLHADDTASPVKTVLIILYAIAVCVALGLVIERLAYRPLRKAPRL